METQNKPEIHWPKAWGAFFAVSFGLLFLWFGCGAPLCQYYTTRNWQSTPCQILSAKLEKHRFIDQSGEKYGYRPEIIYNYTFGDQTYVGRYTNLYEAFGDEAAAAAVIEQYPANATLRCFVNPAKPEQSTLSRKIPDYVWFGWTPLPLVIFGIWLARSARGIPKETGNIRQQKKRADG